MATLRSYTWAVEEKAPGGAWRVKLMDTETSDLDCAAYAANKISELQFHGYHLIEADGQRLHVSDWGVFKPQRKRTS